MIPWQLLPPTTVLLAIFALRSIDVTLSTLRMLAVVRGRRMVAWLLGFTGALLFISAIAGVLSALHGPVGLVTYAAAYATGSLAGMTIERRLAPGRVLLRIFTPGPAVGVAAALHDAGIGATRIPARTPGDAELVLCYAPRRSAARLRDLARAAEPASTITLENVRSLYGGWGA